MVSGRESPSGGHQQLSFKQFQYQRFSASPTHTCNDDGKNSNSNGERVEEKTSSTTATSQQTVRPSIVNGLLRLDLTADAVFRAAWALVLSRHFACESVEYDVFLHQGDAEVDTELIDPTWCLSGEQVTVPLDAQTPLAEYLRLFPQRLSLSSSASLRGRCSCSASSSCSCSQPSSSTSSPTRASALRPPRASSVVVPCLGRSSPRSLQGLVAGTGNGTAELVLAPYFSDAGNICVRCYHDHHLESLSASIFASHFVNIAVGLFDFLAHSSFPNAAVADAFPAQPSPSRLGDIAMFSKDEEMLLRERARPRKPIQEIEIGSYHQKFRRQARLTPDLPALEDENYKTISYGRLDALTDALADILVSRVSQLSLQTYIDHFIECDGIKGTAPVGLCMAKSADLVVCMLAIWKAGFATVVLDPTHPLPRNKYIAIQSRCLFVFVDPGHEDDFENAWPFDMAELELPKTAESRELLRAEDINVQEDAHRLAYIVYTSGTTGVPKGVRHSYVSSQVIAHESKLGFKCLWFLNPISSASYMVLGSALMTGACLCIVSKARMTDLTGCINDHKIQEVAITPTALGLTTPNQVPSLTRLVLLGEGLRPDIVAQWKEKAEVWPNYGSSEIGSIHWAQLHRMDNFPPAYSTPMADVSVYVMRPGIPKLVAQLVRGELCFGSTHLSAGYLDMPEETAAKFIPNPFAADYGHTRLYRSGDMGMILEDGRVAILGRIDQQVKIDGNRVEVGEVEAILPRHPAVETARVMGGHLPNGKLVLVACIVLKKSEPTRQHNGSNGTSSYSTVTPRNWNVLRKELQQHVQNHLPSYMVPNRWFQLDDIPRTATGKANLGELRKQVEQLLSADSSLTETNGDGTQKSAASELSDSESLLLTACNYTLGDATGNIGAFELDLLNRSFVEAGGSSLSAMFVSNWLKKKGLSLGTQDLLSPSTLQDLAAAMRKPSDMVAHSNGADNLSNVVDGGADKPQAQKRRTSEDSDPDYVKVGRSFEFLSLAPSWHVNEDEIEDAFVASPSQNAMFSMSLCDSRQNNIMHFVDTSKYSTEHLMESIQRLISLKPILRSVFVPLNPDAAALGTDSWLSYKPSTQRFVQIVKKDIRFNFVSNGGARTIKEYSEVEIKRGWQAGEPLYRVSLLKESNIMAFSFNHAIVDAWSDNMVFNEDLFELLNDGNIQDSFGSSCLLCQSQRPLDGDNGRRPLFGDWAREMYGEAITSDGSDASTQAQHYQQQWKQYMAGSTASFLEGALQVAEPRPLPTSKTYIQELHTPYGAFCKAHNVTSGSLGLAAWALTVASVIGTKRPEVTFYRMGSNRSTTADATRTEGSMLSMTPTRAPLRRSTTLLELARTMLADHGRMAPADPFYVDEVTHNDAVPSHTAECPGHPLSWRPVHGNTFFNHIPVIDHGEDCPKRERRLPDLTQEIFDDHIAGFAVECDFIELDPRKGEELSVEVCSFLEESLSHKMKEFMALAFEAIALAGERVTVGELLGRGLEGLRTDVQGWRAIKEREAGAEVRKGFPPLF